MNISATNIYFIKKITNTAITLFKNYTQRYKEINKYFKHFHHITVNSPPPCEVLNNHNIT